jgi:flagellar FliJ protein
MAMSQLALLIKVQLEKEEKLQALFAQAQQFMLQAQQKYDGLASYRTDYVRQSQQRGAQGMQSRQFNQYLNFITKLDQALEQQNRQILQAKKVVEQRRLAWLDMQKKRKALELLIEKERQTLAVKAARTEQKLFDEIASQQYFRRLQQNAQGY